MTKSNTTATQKPATVAEAQARLHAAIASLGEAARSLRELRPTVDGVDSVANEVIAALVDGGVLDSRVFLASLTMIHALDPRRQRAREEREVEEKRLLAIREAEAANRPEAAEARRQKAIDAALRTLSDYRNLRNHPRYKEAQDSLRELGAEVPSFWVGASA